MTCREFVEFLGDYLSGDLPPHQAARFDEHLARCPSCASYTRTYREAVRLGRRAVLSSDGPVPDDVPEDLVRAIIAARDEKP